MAFKTLRCLCDLPALTRRGRKQLRYRDQQPVMAVGDDQIDVGGSSSAQVLQQARLSILVLFSASSQGEHLFVACQIDP
jgi:hypothetical protein